MARIDDDDYLHFSGDGDNITEPGIMDNIEDMD